jgi:hypothetical protein
MDREQRVLNALQGRDDEVELAITAAIIKSCIEGRPFGSESVARDTPLRTGSQQVARRRKRVPINGNYWCSTKGFEPTRENAEIAIGPYRHRLGELAKQLGYATEVELLEAISQIPTHAEWSRQFGSLASAVSGFRGRPDGAPFGLEWWGKPI